MMKAIAGLDPTAVLNGIFTVAQAIYDRVQLVKANRSQCKTLADRIEVIVLALKGLKELPRSENFIIALQRMHVHVCERFELFTPTKCATS